MGSNESELGRAAEAAGESAALAREAFHHVEGVRLRDPSLVEIDRFADVGTSLRVAVADLDRIGVLLRALGAGENG